MTKDEQIKSAMADCGMTARDCKGSADYCAYAFEHNDEAAAREYFRHLSENVARLRSQIGYLDHVKAKP